MAKIETQVAGNPYQTRADNFSYSAHGAIKHLQIGNGLWESAVFNSRLQVTQLGFGNSPTDTSLWKLNYDFGTTDNNGNVKGQMITVPGINPLVQTYSYDSLSRLKSVQETSNGNQTFKQTFLYDRYGNRNFDVNQTTTLGNCPANECNPQIDANTNRITSNGYTYDLAGNIITDVQGRSFTFNGDNKQVEVKDASNNVIGQYFYDGDGKRIKKVTSSENTTFVYSGGKLVAEYLLTNQTPQTPTTQYTVTDMLGSPRVISDGNGNIISRRDFMPFGEEINNLGGRSASVGYQVDNVRQKFTGYQRDDETNLDFAEARYYNSQNGRFTAVDPLLASGKSADPQTFNRYAYVMNNPLVLVDPSGMQAGWAYYDQKMEDGRDGRSFKYFTSPEQMETYNGARGTSFQKWQGGEFYLFADKTILNMNANGDSTEFSWFGSQEGWDTLVAAQQSGQGLDNIQKSALYMGRDIQSFLGSLTGLPLTSESQSVERPPILEAGIPSPKSGIVNRGLLTAGDEVPNAGGVIRSLVTTQDKIYYRVSSPTQRDMGGFLTAIPPRSSAFAREALALPQFNNASLIQEVLVPAGTRLQRSRALPAFGRRGGGEQFQLLDTIPNRNFRPRIPFQP